MTMASEQRLRITIEAVDRASQTIESIGGRMASQFRRLRAGMLLIGGIVVGFSAAASRAAMNQQLALDNLRGTLEAMSQR